MKTREESLWVADEGGAAPALVFIHGNSLSADCWEPQVAAEELAAWRRISFDLPGHGRSAFSPKPERRYSLPGYAECVQDLAEALELESVVLIGHSLGGHIALEVAQDLPQLAGIFVAGTPPIAGVPTMSEAFRPSPALDFIYTAELSSEEANQWAAAMVAPGTDPPDWAASAIQSVDPRARPLLMESAGEGRLRDEVAVARELDCPLAVAHARRDAIVEPSYLEALEIPMWRGEVQYLEDTGHLPQWEQPAQFNRLLREFLEELGAPA